MTKQIRKSDLQRIIREEYVRVLLEKSGHRVTESRVRLLAERMDNEELNELFGSLGKAIKAGAEAFKQARGEEKAASAAEKEKLRKDYNTVALNRVRAEDWLMQKEGEFKSEIKKELKKLGYNEPDMAEEGEVVDQVLKAIAAQSPNMIKVAARAEGEETFRARPAGFGRGVPGTATGTGRAGAGAAAGGVGAVRAA